MIEPTVHNGRATDANARRSTRDWRFAYLAVLVLVAFLLYTVVMYLVVNDPLERTAFGEMFGAFSALFSAFAFAAVIYSIFQHGEELARQQKEADATRLAVAAELKTAEETRVELAKTARLNALAILARTYAASLDYIDSMSADSVDRSGAKVEVFRLYKDVITETERLCDVEKGLFYEETDTDDWRQFRKGLPKEFKL